MSFRRNNTAPRAFTLLELVLAVTIFAVMTGLVAGIVYSLPRSWSNLNEEAARLRALTRIDRFADAVVRNAVPFSWPDEYGQSQLAFDGRSDLLYLAARRRIVGAGEGGFLFVVVALRGSDLVAQYRGEPIPIRSDDKEEIMSESLHEEVLVSGVKSFSLRYADWDTGDLVWLDEWDRDKHDTIPAAIAWEIEFNDGTVEKYLRRTAGNSYYTSYGRRSESK